MTVSRREFTKKMALSGAALTAAALLPGGLSAPAGWASTVVTARSKDLERRGNDMVREHARAYLNRALQALTGEKSAAAAWKALFKPHEKVGIKLSCLPGKALSSSPGLVAAIVDGLRSAGLQSDRIYIWERTRRELDRAGFEPGRIKGAAITATDALPGGGYTGEIRFARSVGTIFSHIMEMVDAHINVPVLKDHDLSGVSVSMKNFYGAIYNPNKFHGNNCDPYIADLNTHPLIKDKLRLVVCDASRIQIDNGPAFYPPYAREYGGLLVAFDPVALDYTGLQIIAAARRKNKLKSLEEAGRAPRYIMTAAALGLGCADRAKIKEIKL